MRSVFNSIKQKTPDTHVLVVGDIILDEYLWGTVSRISPEAPVPIVDVSGTTYALGGAANTANNLRQLGCNVSLMGIIGNDPGERVLDLIESAGINGITYPTEQRVTTKKTRVMAHNQHVIRMDSECRFMIPNKVADFFTYSFSELESIPDAIIFADYGKGMFHPVLFCFLADSARSHNIPFLVDPKGSNWEFYNGATVITPSLTEAEGAIGRKIDANKDEELEDAAIAIREKTGCDTVLLTLGDKGIFYYGRSKDKYDRIITTKHIPIKDPRTVYDVSGAGDTVMAVFALGLALKQDPIATAELANLVAGIVVGKLGTATANLQEIEGRLNVVCTAIWKPKGKVMSYQDLLSWEALQHSNIKTVLIECCFDTLSQQIIDNIKRYKESGWIVFCDVISHIDNGSSKIEERIALASSIDAVDFVLAYNQECPQRKIRQHFDDYIQLVCPLKNMEEILV